MRIVLENADWSALAVWDTYSLSSTEDCFLWLWNWKAMHGQPLLTFLPGNMLCFSVLGLESLHGEGRGEEMVCVCVCVGVCVLHWAV